MIYSIVYQNLRSYIYPDKFELIAQDDRVVETINIPTKLMSLFSDVAYRDLIVLDYLDRKTGDTKPTVDSDILKKFVILMNRKLGGTLLLDSYGDNELQLSGIKVNITNAGAAKYITATIGPTKRNFPINLDTTVELLHPIFLVAALKNSKSKPCCGGKKKSK